MTGLSTMRRLFGVELLINIAARSAVGILSATVFSLVVWWGTRIFLKLNPADLGLEIYFLTQATIIGGAATVVVVLSWWNTQSSRRVHWLSTALILGATVFSAWLFNEIRGIETHYALSGGVLRVEVFSIRHMVSSLLIGAVVGGNIFAAALYLYRVVRHNEV